MQKKSILRNLIALSLIPGFGARKIREFARSQENIANFFNLSKSKLRSFEGVGEASALAILSFKDWERVDSIISDTERIGASLVTISDTVYPELLKQIYDPPSLYWMKGNPEVFEKPGIAVIGTRNPSMYGKKKAAQLAGELAEKGFCIVSGLAYGIDAIAHRAALDANGSTVAVLGSGIDNIYPQKHLKLAKDIVLSGGAVISEFPLGAKPDAGNFPIRNRIVSGMSLGVLVIESGMQGGSMITAELGLDQNREIFAIPHNLDNLSGSGGNYLIKKGAAKLVQVLDDIVVELPVQYNGRAEENKIEWPEKQKWRELDLDEMSRCVCEKLEEESFQVDDLAEALETNTSNLLVTLLQLEMEGIVRQKAGKIFELI